MTRPIPQPQPHEAFGPCYTFVHHNRHVLHTTYNETVLSCCWCITTWYNIFRGTGISSESTWTRHVASFISLNVRKYAFVLPSKYLSNTNKTSSASNACTTNSSKASMYVRSVSDGHWVVHISADTIVSEISANLSDMTTCRVFLRTDISVFFIRPFYSNIDDGYAASSVDNTAAMSMLCPLTWWSITRA